MTERAIDISVIIPARNEAKSIGKCLKAALSQNTSYSYEIIVIDSGSDDGTPDIAREFREVDLIRIAPEEFGHGRTRNLGAKRARGKYLVFLNADAAPAGAGWLDALIDPLKNNDQAAASFSAHLPANDCPMYMARDIEAPMAFSTVSAAIKKEVWEKYPFDDNALIAEDLEWARRVAAAGYKIVFAPSSQVLHSHKYRPAELFRIKYLTGREAVRTLYKGRRPFRSLFLCVGGMMFKIAGDVVYIIRRESSFSVKMKEISASFLARILSFTGRLLGELVG